MDLFPFWVLYKPYSVAKILALVDITSQFRFTMDNNNEPAIFIHSGSYYTLKFYQC